MAYLRLVHSAPPLPAPVSTCLDAFDRELNYVFETLQRLGANSSEVEEYRTRDLRGVASELGDPGQDPPDSTLYFRGGVPIIFAHRRRRVRETPYAGLDPEDGAAGPEGSLQSKQSIALLMAALERVPLPRRAVIIMHELDGVPVADVSRRLSYQSIRHLCTAPQRAEGVGSGCFSGCSRREGGDEARGCFARFRATDAGRAWAEHPSRTGRRPRTCARPRARALAVAPVRTPEPAPEARGRGLLLALAAWVALAVGAAAAVAALRTRRAPRSGSGATVAPDCGLDGAHRDPRQADRRLETKGDRQAPAARRFATRPVESYAAELELLQTGSSCLRGTGLPGRARRRFSEHARRFPGGRLAEEREALARSLALADSGRPDEARRAAGAFGERFPRSVLLPRFQGASKERGVVVFRRHRRRRRGCDAAR